MTRTCLCENYEAAQHATELFKIEHIGFARFVVFVAPISLVLYAAALLIRFMVQSLPKDSSRLQLIAFPIIALIVFITSLIGLIAGILESEGLVKAASILASLTVITVYLLGQRYPRFLVALATENMRPA